MLRIRCAATPEDAPIPVHSRDGDRVGVVVDRGEDALSVAVDADAPAVVCDALDCDAGADRVRVPDALVADDGDDVRLVV